MNNDNIPKVDNENIPEGFKIEEFNSLEELLWEQEYERKKFKLYTSCPYKDRFSLKGDYY